MKAPKIKNWDKVPDDKIHPNHFAVYKHKDRTLTVVVIEVNAASKEDALYVCKLFKSDSKYLQGQGETSTIVETPKEIPDGIDEIV